MRNLPAILALVIVTGVGLPVLAQTVPAASASARASTLGPEPLSAKSLSAETGQGVSNTVLSEQQLSATSSGNSVVADVMRTGDVAFSTSALTGFTGVGNFVINTGNNSNLQGTISVNIVTNAPPL